MNSILLSSFLLITCLIIFQACSTEELRPQTRMAYEIDLKVSNSLEQKYKMHFMGVKLGGPEKIDLMGLIFHIKRRLSKQECRELIVNSIGEYLAAINENAEFQKYLFQSPFPIKNIEIDIHIETEDGKDVYYPDISLVGIIRGKVDYLSDDPENPYKYKSKEEESYEEALRIVEAKSSQLPIQHPDI
jgi:hypothetical protein